MHSYTIYILNKSVVEWFNILLNIRENLSSLKYIEKYMANCFSSYKFWVDCLIERWPYKLQIEVQMYYEQVLSMQIDNTDVYSGRKECTIYSNTIYILIINYN